VTLWLILGVGAGAIGLLLYVLMRIRRDARKAVNYEHLANDVRLRNEARSARDGLDDAARKRLRDKYTKRK